MRIGIILAFLVSLALTTPTQDDGLVQAKLVEASLNFISLDNEETIRVFQEWWDKLDDKDSTLVTMLVSHKLDGVF